MQHSEENQAKNPQKMLIEELSIFLGIHRRLRKIVESLRIKDQSCEKEINDRCDGVLKALVHADSQEAFAIQESCLRGLLSQLTQKANKLSNNEVITQRDESLQFIQIQQILQNVNRSNFSRRRTFYLSGIKNKLWKDAFAKLAMQKNDQDFDAYKKQLLNDMVPKLTNPVAKLLVEIEDEIGRFVSYRRSHLKSKINRWIQFSAFSWVGVDGLLLLAATVIGFAYPALGIPILILTVASFGYGFLELARTSKNLVMQNKVPSLEGSNLDEPTKKELQDKFPEIDINALLIEHTNEENQWLEERKRFRFISCVFSVLGVLFAAGGFIFFFPPVGIPMAAVLAATIMNGILFVGSVSLIATKVTHEQKKINLMEEAARAMIKENKGLMEKVVTVESFPGLDSTAKLHELDIWNEKSPSTDPLEDDPFRRSAGPQSSSKEEEDVPDPRPLDHFEK